MDKTTILLIGQQSLSISKIRSLLQEEEIHVLHEEVPERALSILKEIDVQLTILFCIDNGIKDLAACQQIVNTHSGLLVLISNEPDCHFHIFALGIGVDMIFPTSHTPELLKAHVFSLLRRFSPTLFQQKHQFGKLIVDQTKRDAFIGQMPASLSTVEFNLLWVLVENMGNVLSRQEIYKKAYDAEYNGYDRSIDLYISRIRQKIGDTADTSQYIKTVRGVGYQFIGDESHT